MIKAVFDYNVILKCGVTKTLRNWKSRYRYGYGSGFYTNQSDTL